jgi:hypothetical protein
MQNVICFTALERGSRGNRPIVYYAFDSVFDRIWKIIKPEIISVLL